MLVTFGRLKSKLQYSCAEKENDVVRILKELLVGIKNMLEKLNSPSSKLKERFLVEKPPKKLGNMRYKI